MSKLRIFYCEDDNTLGSLVKEYLCGQGFEVDLFADGDLGIENFSKSNYDLCILDLMMPKKDGFEVAQEIRSHDDNVPIIFLTANQQKENSLTAFKVGADDYMNKPFSLEELSLHIEAVTRRVRGQAEVKVMDAVPSYGIGKFLFDTKKQTLSIGDQVQDLTTKESELLALLCHYANQTLERNLALKLIWKNANFFNARSMDVYITKLRKHLLADPTIEIKNVHGKGYRLNVPEIKKGIE